MGGNVSDILERRQLEQRLRHAYRNIARQRVRRLKGVTLSEHAHVHPMEDGAFVEVTIWIPRKDTKL